MRSFQKGHIFMSKIKMLTLKKNPSFNSKKEDRTGDNC